MSHLNPGLISAYNSLTDKHLAGYFSNTRIRRHLHRAGLITRSGRIIPDKEYRHKLIQRAHHRHVRECLAQAIFHKVLEMERLHQIEIKRKLEEFARRERVHKMKMERSKRFEEDIIHILSPHPPMGTKDNRKQHSGPEGDHSESSESLGSSRPNTAPGKMQRPVRLKPIHSNNTTASLRRSSPYRLMESSNENDQSFTCNESQRRFQTMEASRGISPYCLPVINNFLTPVPPATKRKGRGVKVTPNGTLRGRRLRPPTSSSGADISEDPPMLRSSVPQSRVCVTMVYFGKAVHLSHDLADMRDEVKVFQQHCGGENLCVYRGRLCEGESFQFVSRRHQGFPFSLTFFLNGLQVERLSSCCEFKHRKGSRLGGRHGHFGLSRVEGASPCYKCIIAMGLDKKPMPPPKRAKEDEGGDEAVTSPKDTPEMDKERTDAPSPSDWETNQQQDMETQGKEGTAAEDKVRDDYEEDFEADDEGPVDHPEAKEKKSPPSGETERQVRKRDTSETEDDDKDDIKSRSATISRVRNHEESDAETTEDLREAKETQKFDEVNQEETVASPQEPNPVDAAATESTVAKDSNTQDSTGDSPEIQISDATDPSGNENKESDDTSGDKEVDESKQDEEQERAKSVQKKLAGAIFNASPCSSEPELSETSTEEEEEPTDKGNKHAVPEKSGTFTEQQQAPVGEIKPEECVGECKVAQDQDEMSELTEKMDESEEELTEKMDESEEELTEKMDESEEEPHENSGSTKHEMVQIDEDDEKVASEEAAAEKDKPEDTDAALHPASEEDIKEENQTSESEEEAAAELTVPDEPQKTEEKEKKTAEEADTQPNKMGQGPKSSEEDESSVSELNKKTDETAVPDNAEAEAAMTASETMEMKAEPSEEQEALSLEEAPVTNPDKKQQRDSEDRAAASETKITTENSSSSSEGSGDTMVEKTADISVDSEKDGGTKDDIKEEEANEVMKEIKDESEKESRDVEEEGTEKSVDDEGEKQESLEESKNKKKQKNPDEITIAEDSAEGEMDETEENDKSNTEEMTENEENIADCVNNDSDTQAKGEPSEKNLGEEDKETNKERAKESEKAEEDENSKYVQDKNDEEISEAKGGTTDKTNKDEDVDTLTAVDEETGDGEMEEKVENDKAEQSESGKNEDDEESEEKKVTAEITEGEEITEECDKRAKENAVESEDVGDGKAADDTRKTEEASTIANEPEDDEKEAEGAGNKSEEIDAENGEISARAENKSHEDETEAPNINDEGKTEEPTGDESPEVRESGNDKLDQAPDTDVAESEAKEEDIVVERQEESAQKDSEQEAVGEELKEKSNSDDLNTDKEGSVENKEDQNCKNSDSDHENRESDSTKNNMNMSNEVTVASLGEQAQSSTDDTTKLHESIAMTDPKTDKDSDDDAAGVEGENAADMEEASKASEEGASVLHKPQAQNNMAESAEEMTLAREDNTDLVTNWVTMHQTSKFFEKFVEPLEDLKDENSDTLASTELPGSESPLKMVTFSEKEQDENESMEITKVVTSELKNKLSEDDEPHENDPGTEETEVKDFIQTTEMEENDIESTNGRSQGHKGSRGSVDEDKVQDAPAQPQAAISKSDMERMAGTHLSAASGKPETQTDEITNDDGPGLNGNPPKTEEEKGLLHSPKTEHHELSASPGGLKDGEETEEQSGEVTEITDFTTSRSEDGSQEESENRDIQSKASDMSVSGDKSRDLQLIKHSLSKDRLSTFSLDETLFGHSSYPLLSAARTESGH
ncbi:glutamate-rich protein 3 [Mastacembelus armatus]|uniref:glutamate-rich protein 3 n=1 Tax=Mastacembelus armatus TaxID=205130 RepID=UPI000E45D111|nr:glutamate-rich protein 3 [Mastacembelus armatus]